MNANQLRYLIQRYDRTPSDENLRKIGVIARIVRPSRPLDEETRDRTLTFIANWKQPIIF